MAFQYDEVPAETKSMLHAHLDACAECRAQMATWQRVTQQLDMWKLPSRRPRRSFAPVLKFAAAAAFVGLAIVAGARVWSLNGEVGQLRAELQRETASRATVSAELREQVVKAASAETQMLITEFAKAIEEKRFEDQRTLLAALQQVQTKHAEGHAALRKELETVAVLTEVSLRQAHNEIANISYTPETK